jgi:hypothetical protein
MTFGTNDIQFNNTQQTSVELYYAESRYAECRNYLNVMLSVIMLNVPMLSVIVLNIVMLSVMTPVL